MSGVDEQPEYLYRRFRDEEIALVELRAEYVRRLMELERVTDLDISISRLLFNQVLEKHTMWSGIRYWFRRRWVFFYEWYRRAIKYR